MKAIVIGAGIGGLCAAIALRNAGLEVVIYEQASAILEVGAGLSLWPNATKAPAWLGTKSSALASPKIGSSTLAGQPNLKRRTRAKNALHLNIAAVLFRDEFYNG